MPMHTTPISLPQRLRQPSDADAWARFEQFYTPLRAPGAGRAGAPEHDAWDLIQAAFVLLPTELPEPSGTLGLAGLLHCMEHEEPGVSRACRQASPHRWSFDWRCAQ